MTPDIKPLIPVHFSEEELDAELEDLLKDPVLPEKNDGEKIIFSSVDAVAADYGNKRTQDKWFDYWSQIKDGRIMASMGDLYQYFKSLRQQSEKGNAAQKKSVDAALVSLRTDFDWPGKQNWLIAGTRLFYQAANENAKIVQHYKCNKPALIKETDLVVPVYRNVEIILVTRDSCGLNYLQVLHDTKDSAEEIISTFEFISDKKRDKIKIWTAALSNSTYTRQSHPARAAGFDYNCDDFRISGYGINVAGCSRWVR
jgi:hypothetical protein